MKVSPCPPSSFGTIGATLLLLLLLVHSTYADMPFCVRNVDCANALMAGSECRAGVCSNPFYERGCFQSILDSRQDQTSTIPHRMRVCNSEDTVETMAKGFCVPPDAALD